MKRLRVFISGPYTKDTPEENIKVAIEVAEKLTKLSPNIFPYIPHLSHYWEKLHPKPWEYWVEHGKAFAEVCDIVFRIPGDSKGADEEVNYILSRTDVPVAYTIEALIKWKDAMYGELD